jgi:hypothetical protein
MYKALVYIWRLCSNLKSNPSNSYYSITQIYFYYNKLAEVKTDIILIDLDI